MENNNSIEKLFFDSKKSSIKGKKYFRVYEEILSKYKNKDITFVEIGVLNGGSLEIWKKFFGSNSRIIGIDLNPECKKFEKDGVEIFIGNQCDPSFWKAFFSKVGNVDVVLDDGGHTNLSQITTTVNTVNNINDGGMLIVEDTHTSYMTEFNNPSNYSFINFSKKTIDDINFTFFKSKKFKFSLNQFIYSIQFYESFTIFNINRNLCSQNKMIENSGKKFSHWDMREKGDEVNIAFLKKVFNFFNIKKVKKFTKYFKGKVNIGSLKKYFE